MRKRGIALLLVFAIVCMISTSGAGTSTGGGGTTTVSRYTTDSLVDRLLKVPSFKFRNYENGIGYGNCPVYTAPSENAFRCTNGKASCWTNTYMSEGGYVSGWLFVRYETNNGGHRVGYVPPSYVRGFQSGMPTPQFDRIPVYAANTIYVTDNPLLLGSSFGQLDPGETFYVLGKYTYVGDWWYIECTVDNKTARGFIDRGSSSFILDNGIVVGPSGNNGTQTHGTDAFGIPSVSPLGTGYICDALVDYGSTGDRKIVRQNADPNSKQITVVYPGYRYPCYAVKRGTTGKDWYYIWVEEDSAWGWISSGNSSLV